MVKERSYTYAIIFRSKSSDALGRAEEGIKEKIADAWVVYKHGPSRFHLWVIEAKAPSRGDLMNEQKKNE